MFQIFILHDDIREQDWLQQTIARMRPETRIKSFDSGSDALKAMIPRPPELILLNASLEDMTAFQFLEKIPPTTRGRVILLGEEDADAVVAFDFRVLDYLKKPYTQTRLKKAITLQEEIEVEDEIPTSAGHQAIIDTILPIKVSGNIFFVEKEQIRYIIASGYYIEVFAEEKRFLVREPMHEVLERLSHPQFVRVHRSSIVNTDYLDHINLIGKGETEAVMKDGKVIRISKTYKEDLLDKLKVS
ncbi:MAG: LytTR family transcriptional regulator DNA-binding domain-containing protein [Saprospiraceae bacterium]|nr:LytTR family transcriptional regulator DNA-binding domain-containing protein [Saprospiraceae bacterium]